MASTSRRQSLDPEKRKVRHLSGVLLRNITLVKRPDTSIDDATLNKTRDKLESIKEAEDESLKLSQSSDNLNAAIRPRAGRRRSSSVWSAQSTGSTPKTWEDAIKEGLVDTMFSLHRMDANEGDKPLYISEVIEQSINPSFMQFDLSVWPSNIKNASTILLKVWLRRGVTEKFMFFLRQEIDLSKLTYLGSLKDRNFDANSVIIILDGSYYGCSFAAEAPPPTRPARSQSHDRTSTAATLLRLKNLGENITDLMATQNILVADIKKGIEKRHQEEVERELAQLHVDDAYAAVNREANRLEALNKELAEKRASIIAKQNAMAEAARAQDFSKLTAEEAEAKAKELHAELLVTQEMMRGQRRRICEDVSQIFNIEETGKPLQFTIRGLQLPNSVDILSTDVPDNEVEAALRFTAECVKMLAMYLEFPLPYDIKEYNTHTWMEDMTSIFRAGDDRNNNREFPLYKKGVADYKFEYGVYLLNKNIEMMAAKHKIKLEDIRLTLPNLKYFLYVLTAGTDELPERQAGRIVYGAPSFRNPSGAPTKEASKKDKDKAKEGMAKPGPENGALVLSEEELTLSLRSKGLREGRMS